MEPAWQLNRIAGIANALEAAILDRVRAPTRHAADIKLPIFGVESSAVDTGTKVADERHDRPLSLSLDFITEQQKMVRRAERQMHALPLERPPFRAGDVDLTAAGVI